MRRRAGVPGVLAALILAFLSNLFGSITHYGSGQGAVYIGSGYLALPDVFKFGALFSVINLTIWAAVGTVAWKALGGPDAYCPPPPPPPPPAHFSPPTAA